VILVRIFFFPSENDTAKSKDKKQVPSNVKIELIKKVQLQDFFISSGEIRASETVNISSEITGKLMSINFTDGATVSKGDLLLKLNDAELQASKRKALVLLQVAEMKEKRLKQMREVNGVSKEEYELAFSNVELAKAEIQSIEAQLEKTEIRAPFSGRVGIRNISPGNIVSPGTSIVSLQQTDPLYLDFHLPEKYALLIKKGERIQFESNSSSQKHEARVFAVETSLNPDTRTLWVRATFKSQNKSLIPGEFVKVEVPLKEDEETILIPTESVISDMKGKKVFIVKNGLAVSRIIQPGLRTETKIQVLEGLLPGDSLIVSGITNLREEAKVKILKN
jgi:membrane fusion protein (multidrug efflux system)